MDLQGGPPLNVRDDTNEVSRRRRKMAAKTSWFTRKRRGGEEERLKKDFGWLGDDMGSEKEKRRRRARTQGPRSGPGRGVRQGQEDSARTKTDMEERKEKTTTAVLLVPYSVGSALQTKVQQAEDEFVALVRGQDRIRVVEKGGDKLHKPPRTQ